MKKQTRKTSTSVGRTTASAVLLLVLLLAVSMANPLAQDVGDAELASQLEPVILEQTVSPGAVNTVVEIPVLKDTYISSNKPSKNYGAAPELRLGYNRDGNNDGALRPLIQFDVARYVPAKAVINQAVLRIYEYAASPVNDSPMRSEARNLATSWDEMLVTWNSHQPGWAGVIGYVEVKAELGWREGPVTGLVRDWHSGATPNNGIIVIGDEHVQERQRIFYSLNANNGLYPRLVVDYTLSTDTTPPVAWVNSLPSWSTSTFPVSWGGGDPGGSGVAYFDVQYRMGGGSWTDWQRQATWPSAQFVGGQNGMAYQFRARAVDGAGNIGSYSAAPPQTMVDSIPPFASVLPLPAYTLEPAFTVSWSGSDNVGGSGIDHYDMQFQVNGGPWQDWLVNTKATSAQFTGAQDGTRYGFRARGIDVAGNVQPYSAGAQAETIAETSGPHSYVLPFKPSITQADSFLVQWTASTAPGLSIEYFDVRYRFANGPWIAWLTNTKLTSTAFTDLNPLDGVYLFEARAMDSAGRLEPFGETPPAGINVDKLPPFMEPKSRLPIVPVGLIR